METLEKIVVDFKLRNFSSFMVQMKQLTNTVVNFSARAENAFFKVGQGIGRNVIQKQKELANSSKRTYGQLEQSLGSLKETVTKSLQGLVVPSKTYKEAVNDMVVGQEELRKSFTNTYGQRSRSRLQMFSDRMRQFKMELLGVMFFGMMVQKAMFGLLRPATQASGMFEIWTTMLTVFFLPIMIALLPIMLMFMNWFLEAPEWLKLAIGGIVLFIGSLGALLFTYGATSLGIRALMADLPTFFKLFSGFKASTDFKNVFSEKGFLTKLGKSKIVKGIVIVAVIALAYAWLKSTSAMFQDLKTSWNERIKNVFQGLFLGAGIGFLVAGPAGAAVGAVIGLGLSLLINLIDISWEQGWSQKIKDWWAISQDKLPSTEYHFNKYKEGMRDVRDVTVQTSSQMESSFNELDYTTEKFGKDFKVLSGGVVTDLESLKSTFEELEMSSTDSVEDMWASIIKTVDFGVSTISKKIMGLTRLRPFFDHLPGGGSAFGGRPTIGGELSIGTGTNSDPFRLPTTVSQTNNINVNDSAELERIMKDNNTDLVHKIQSGG